MHGFLKFWTILTLVAVMVSLGGCKAMYNAKPIPGVPQPDERLKQISELGKKRLECSAREAGRVRADPFYDRS